MTIFKDSLLFSYGTISSGPNYTYISYDDGATISQAFKLDSTGGYTASFICNKTDCISTRYTTTKSYYSNHSSNGINWVLASSSDLDMKTYVTPTIGMENFFLSTIEASTTVNRSFNGGVTWDYYAPIYIDGVKNDRRLSSITCTNFDKTICCILAAGEDYILRSVDSTYNTYKVLAPATSTTPGTKIVVRAK
jgi:hypothetical protein